MPECVLVAARGARAGRASMRRHYFGTIIPLQLGMARSHSTEGRASIPKARLTQSQYLL